MMETTTVHSSQLSPEQIMKWRDDYEANINSSKPTKVIWREREWTIIGVNQHFDMTAGKESYTFTLRQ